jgi:hypothetical protein
MRRACSGGLPMVRHLFRRGRGLGGAGCVVGAATHVAGLGLSGDHFEDGRWCLGYMLEGVVDNPKSRDDVRRNPKERER